MKPEYKIISDLIEKNAKVLDVGCNDGSLLNFFKDSSLFSSYGPTWALNKGSKPFLFASAWRSKIESFFLP